MTLAGDTQASVLQALTYAGQGLTITKVTEGTYNPATGTTSGGSTTDYTGTGLLHAYRNFDIDGTRILATDRKLILAASGLSYVPTTGDKITYGSTVYSVIAISPFEFNGTAFAYVLQVRTI